MITRRSFFSIFPAFVLAPFVASAAELVELKHHVRRVSLFDGVMHHPGIPDGVYVAGTIRDLDLEYC